MKYNEYITSIKIYNLRYIIHLVEQLRRCETRFPYYFYPSYFCLIFKDNILNTKIHEIKIYIISIKIYNLRYIIHLVQQIRRLNSVPKLCLSVTFLFSLPEDNILFETIYTEIYNIKI